MSFKRDILIFLYGVSCWWLVGACVYLDEVAEGYIVLRHYQKLRERDRANAPERKRSREAIAKRLQDTKSFPNRALLDALAFVESSNSPSAVSPVGARGLYQFMPDTWNDVMTEPFAKAFDPDLSETAAIHYLEWIKSTLVKWKGSADLIDVLACWHGGIGRYRRLEYDLARMPERTKQFVARVTARMRIHDN